MGEVQLEKKGHRGAWHIDGDEGRLAELTFTAGEDGKVVVLDHTEVSPTLRGQGIAKKLVEAAVAWARRENVRIVPVCPFAKAVFEREPSLRDVLA
jgi:predicted GNAT family acetyltransferase